MYKKGLFFGVATALVTPFDGKKVDYPAFGELIDRQIEAGIDALVICGTTGEPCSLSPYEREKVLEYALGRAKKRTFMIAGTGTSDTKRTCAMTKKAALLGYDAALVVTPYYNKTSQQGLEEHYAAVSACADIPLIVYNVPARTGMNVFPSTYLRLARIETVSGAKEASGDFLQHTQSIEKCKSSGLYCYCGSDEYALAALALGADGIISVLSNVFPKLALRLYCLVENGNMQEAQELWRLLFPFVRELFCTVNPSPVKYALSLLGVCKSSVRLPLAEPDAAEKLRIASAMEPLRHL
ncbi:MAG TPA: 4-hydroxy-tetrahydrodipicolinate synthase [Bacillota bacterium]|nr:4-hydroxy-tetrahydrodipicolinate synthase [Bacillota bacterium]